MTGGAPGASRDRRCQADAALGAGGTEAGSGGWEQLSLTFDDDSLTYKGFEGVLTVGLVFPVTPWLGIGPFISASIGSYSRLDAVVAGGTGTEAVRNQALHSWFVLGVRFDLPGS